MRTLRQVADIVLVVLAAARLTRLFTEDHLGRWYFQDPIDAWGNRHETAAITAATDAIERRTVIDVDAAIAELAGYDESRPWTWQKRLSEGAGCKWCVGFWLGGLVLAADVLTRTTAFGWARPLFRFVTGVLALNLASNAVGRWTGTLS